MRKSVREPRHELSEESPARVVVERVGDVVGHMLHHHSDYELHLIHKGRGAYFLRNGQQPFFANDLLVFRSNVPHCRIMSADRQVEKTRLEFIPRLLRDRPDVAEVFGALPISVHLDKDDTVAVEFMFQTIAKELRFREQHWREIIIAEVEKLAYMAERASHKESPHLLQHPAVRRVMEHIEQHFTEALSLQHLAGIAGLSPDYLSSLFTHQTGTRLKQYILQRRIVEAMKLLLEYPTMKVSDVGLAVGFTHFADFNRIFKRMTGLTPTSYRKISHVSSR